jgi:hypothetical protein
MRGRRATSKPAAPPTLGVNDDYHDISMRWWAAAKPKPDSSRRRGEKTAIASWYKFGQASSISPKFKQCERSSKFPNVMVTPSMLKKT